nr:hypothetical protein [Tanacetum cinerariifolium]
MPGFNSIVRAFASLGHDLVEEFFKRCSIFCILWSGYMVLRDLPLHRSSSYGQFMIKASRGLLLHSRVRFIGFSPLVGESEYDVPAREEFTTFLNILFDADYESDSSDDQSFSDEDASEKIFSNPLLIDPLFDEFAGELALLKSIPSGIDETDCDPEEDIRLIEKLLYDNSSPRPPKEFVSANSDTKTESFSPSRIPDDDSERDILILKDLPSHDTLSLPEKESFHFDIPSFSRPPTKPPDGDT